MLSSQFKFSADRQTDRRTDGKTICRGIKTSIRSLKGWILCNRVEYLIVWHFIPVLTLYCTAVVSAPIHAFPEFSKPVLRTMFFPSHWLLSNINIVEKVDSSERGINPITMTIINRWTEY